MKAGSEGKKRFFCQKKKVKCFHACNCIMRCEIKLNNSFLEMCGNTCTGKEEEDDEEDQKFY